MGIKLVCDFETTKRQIKNKKRARGDLSEGGAFGSCGIIDEDVVRGKRAVNDAEGVEEGDRGRDVERQLEALPRGKDGLHKDDEDRPERGHIETTL